MDRKIGPLVRVISAEALDGFKVRITFEDKSEKVIDLEQYLHGPIFADIRAKPEIFRAVRVDGNTICWPNGADIDPDVLYYDLKPDWMEVRSEETK
jgi:uncharacterized protein DUF2442